MRKAVLGLLVVGLSLLAFITSAFVGDAKAQSCVAAPSGDVPEGVGLEELSE